MAKRFTNTEKWKTKFFRELKPKYKMLWLYIWDDCNHAGVWEVNLSLACYHIGFEVTEKTALMQFDVAVEVIQDGLKWFVPSFIRDQYSLPLNKKNSAHLGVLRVLHAAGIDCDQFLFGGELPWDVVPDYEE